MIKIICGGIGCLSGETEIRLSRRKNTKKYLLKDIYSRFNNRWDTKTPTYIRSFNGEEIKLYPIKNVFYSGKKDVYELKLENGKKIKSTLCHRFMTGTGWKKLEFITRNDYIMCDRIRPVKSKLFIPKLSDSYVNGLKYHPYSQKLRDRKNGRIEVHRLIYESKLNNIGFKDYIISLCNYEEESKQFIFINPKTHVVHHKDHNHYNNNTNNLELMSRTEHYKHHSDESYRNFNQAEPYYSKVKSIKYVGIEKTYDIECINHPNFSANEIIVHNSGKSTAAVKEIVVVLTRDSGIIRHRKN